jgi:hypothetical protein
VDVVPHSGSRSNPKQFGKVALGAGITAFVISVCWLIHSCYLIVSSYSAPGQITDLIPDKHHQDVNYPVFTYTDMNGTEHTIHSNTGSSGWLAYHVGDRITVLYSPNNLDNPWIHDWTIWVVPLLIITFGAIVVPLGIFFIRSG